MEFQIRPILSVLSAMTYGTEIWALTTQAKNNLAAAQTKM